MLELKGKINKDCKVFCDKVEDSAMATIYSILDDEVSKGVPVRIMPDVHQGVDITIGFTMPITDRVNPNHIGVDIGCSVSIFSVPKDEISRYTLADINERIRSAVPMGFSRNDKAYAFSGYMETEVQCLCRKIGLDYGDVCRQIGSLGGGNHFIEMGESEIGVHFFIHCGSRNFGKQVCDYHSKKAKAGGSKYLFGEDMREYIADMGIAQTFARYNHEVIKRAILDVLDIQIQIGGEWAEIFTSHNYIGEDNIIRKGAVSAKEGEYLLIPMNMRDGVLVCRGKGNADWNNSAPHGAGRIYSRSKAKKELSMEEFESEMDGIYSTSVTDSNIDESPMAYKPMQEIVDTIGDTVEILAIVKPILNIKA